MDSVKCASVLFIFLSAEVQSSTLSTDPAKALMLDVMLRGGLFKTAVSNLECRRLNTSISGFAEVPLRVLLLKSQQG